MINFKLHWQDATIEDRKAVYNAYTQMSDDGIEKASWPDFDARMYGSNFYTIKYTFCPVGYWG